MKITRNKTIYRNGNSRSYRAECAENEGRYPISKCASYFGISLKLFKEALEYSCIKSTEWHHVSKYANKVYFYDTTEILTNFSFWYFIKNKSRKNKNTAIINMRNIAKTNVFERLSDLEIRVKNPKFSSDLKRRCNEFNIPFDVLFEALPYDESVKYPNQTVSVRNGTRIEDDTRMRRNGDIFVVGTCEVSISKYVKPFDLTKNIIRGIIKNKPVFRSFDHFNKNYKPILNTRKLLFGLQNLKNGFSFLNHNSFMNESTKNHNAKNKLIQLFNERNRK